MIHEKYVLHRRRNDFSVGEAITGEKQSKQSNSKYNFNIATIHHLTADNTGQRRSELLRGGATIRYRPMQCTMGSVAKPQKLGNFQEFLCYK